MKRPLPKISDEQLFCRSRGIAEEDAVSLIVSGFAKEVMQQLPMEFAIEAAKLDQYQFGRKCRIMMLLTPDLPPQRHDDKSWSFGRSDHGGRNAGSNGQLPIWLTWIFIFDNPRREKAIILTMTVRWNGNFLLKPRRCRHDLAAAGSATCRRTQLCPDQPF